MAKLNAAGSALVYSTFLGGNDVDRGRGIATDAAGNAYVTGQTPGRPISRPPIRFPPASGPRRCRQRSYVAKLNAAGSALVYSDIPRRQQWQGGQGNGIAVDAAGNAYVTGQTLLGQFPDLPVHPLQAV